MSHDHWQTPILAGPLVPDAQMRMAREWFEDNRRCRSLLCTRDFLGDSVFEAPEELFSYLKDRLPADAHLAQWSYDKRRDLFCLLVHSMEFDAVPEGEPWPKMVLRFFG